MGTTGLTNTATSSLANISLFRSPSLNSSGTVILQFCAFFESSEPRFGLATVFRSFGCLDGQHRRTTDNKNGDGVASFDRPSCLNLVPIRMDNTAGFNANLGLQYGRQNSPKG